MEKEFIPYEQASDLKDLGFDGECIAFYNGTFLDFKIQGGDICSSYLSTENRGECPNAPLYQQAFRWFREKYDLHVHIRKEDYVYKNIHNNYFHFDISKGEQTDITKQEDLYSNLMDECEQNIPGNYLDNEKLNILIFEKGFAFKIYEETELACLKKLIEIVKNKGYEKHTHITNR
jgi:hypothetical protein